MVKPKETASDKIMKDPASDQLESLDYPLMAYMALYIFREIYIVQNLKELVFAKIKAVIEVINKPHTEDDQRGVISLLKLAYTIIPANKSSADLQEWLAHYAAFSLRSSAASLHSMASSNLVQIWLRKY
ncbi:hypothetical protein BDV40DRAFT_302479 [Aspergillus tamarii]|uniref:Uncharacterized protein n=1 Tax=Aspergillus tamarii TaxID=41984 RepID=A0A5N6UQI8_ASPTM|nr:hypothetical protein BDV40DRAFT_302479 [Aspergillus tamarii]